MANSRITNSIYNFISSVVGQFITIVMMFLVRTVFIHTLGGEYLGINGLFSNILSMLSLAEFGVGSALTFYLYEPIAKDDHHRIAVLMQFYKKVYQGIGIVIAFMGVILIPFLPYLISDYSKLGILGINPILIYGLYLFKTVSTYFFFAYKSAIIRANQKEYLINVITYFFSILSSFVQMAVLWLYPKFEVYVVVLILEIILQNMFCAILSDKMYPYIKQHTSEKLDFKEVKKIFKDCAAIFLYRLNAVVLKSTDNIILSSFLGLGAVGTYSNYYVFYTTINTLFVKIFNSVLHSLGNLHTTHNYEHEYKIFEVIQLIIAILGGTAGVGIAVVADSFIEAWIGKTWIIPQPFSILMGIEIFTLCARVAISRYRTSMGLFQQAKYRPLFGMIINLAVSILLVKQMGICGVLIGTIVADWSTFMWFDPWIIHKYGFENTYSVSRYFKKLFKYLVIILGVGCLDWFICTSLFQNEGWLYVIPQVMICGLSVPMALMALTFHQEEGQYIIRLFTKYANKIKRKLIK